MGSCDQEENTGYSTFVVTTPTLTVTTAANASLIEDDSFFEFTATLSATQLVDTKLSISQIGGNATIGDDFTVDGSITIPAGSLTATGKITILSDELKEETETVTIQIGDNATANAALTPAIMEFTILNYTEGDLVIDMTWAMSEITTDNSGEEVEPEDFADLRFNLSSAPNNIDIVESSDDDDDAGFKTFVLSSELPDGDYYIVADFATVNEDLDRDLNINLEINQAGVINHREDEFLGALNSIQNCSFYYYAMLKIVKTGSTYEITREAVAPLYNIADFVGTWTGEDFYGNTTTSVVTSLSPEGKLQITGIGVDFMEIEWEETITDMATLTMDVDPLTGAFTIEETYYMTTFYDGAESDPYSLSAVGQLNPCGNGSMYIDYDLIQDGTSYTSWLTQYGYGFEENIELD